MRRGGRGGQTMDVGSRCGGWVWWGFKDEMVSVGGGITWGWDG